MSVVSIPSDIGLVLPIGGFVGFVHHGFIEWRSINCCIDLFTGKNHQLPNSFVVTERDFDGGRFIATRQDNKKRKTDCIVVDEATDAEVFRFSVDALGGTIRILRKSGQFVFATYDHRFFVYDLKRGNLVHVIDPFRWGFPLNFGATAAFLLWCIVWLRIVSSIHPFGWIDTVVCIGTFIAYATYQFYFSIGFQKEVFLLSNVGVLMSSIVLTNIWLCMGRKRLFRRTAPIVLVFGLAVGLIVCWIEQPETQSYLIAGVTVLTLGMMLPLIAMRWAGVRFQNTKLDSTTEICQSNERESYVNLRDIFLFTFVSAIVTSIFRRIPLSHWYGFWFERGFGSFLFLVGIHFAGLVVISVLAIWTSFSRRGFVSRWGPWLVVAVGWLSINEIFQQWPLFYVLGSFAIASSATLFIGCLSYRMRGWRFVEDGTLPIFK